MKKVAFFVFGLTFLIHFNTLGQSIVSSRHNLSVSGLGTVKATSESEVCIFCHTPHSSAPLNPLWNKNASGVTYTLYSSSTLQAVPGQPDGSAILCLSCHDGTIALGAVVSRTTDIDFGGITTMPVGRYNLATNLSDDHPVSFDYSTSASGDNQIKASPLMPAQLENGRVQCVSCHNPHNDINTKFLVATKQYSDLCFKCHDRNFWTTTSHNLSMATWNGTGTNPWAHIEVPFATVAENACENCHNPHNSAGIPRLLKASAEESNCLDCHNGNVAATDIQTQALKTYAHDVYGYNNLHDPAEATLIGATPHVECTDCHNPHAVNNATAVAPNAKGFQTGVRGIDTGGNAITTINYEYELCYRCHTDNAVTSSPTSRQVVQNNVRIEFDLGNPSHHAVEGPGANPNVPSLILPLTTASIIYCTDCHASDGGGEAGPHGSIYPQIMKLRFVTSDPNPESATDYELCYSCHSRTSILNDESFADHDTHIRGRDTSCNVCHDPHGVTAEGTNDHTHLINFDLDVVSQLNAWPINFNDRGTFSGDCTLVCHGRRHNRKSY